MFEIEILAPLGKFEDLRDIEEAGADAVYAGINGFSSRPASVDLSVEEMREATMYMHARGKKIYAALNACVSNNDIDRFVCVAKKMDKIGVDAVIVSDYGVLKALENQLMHTKLHASTLLGVYNSETVKVLRDMGVSRVVISSDLFIEEIADIMWNVPDMEYEVIAAGGICFQCNRQCKLPHGVWNGEYQVKCQKKFVLKRGNEILGEANPIGAPQIRLYSALGIYASMGIQSFKIEGRTNSVGVISKRVEELCDAKFYWNEHKKDKQGYLHYISRYLEGRK